MTTTTQTKTQYFALYDTNAFKIAGYVSFKGSCISIISDVPRLLRNFWIP